MRRVLLSLVFNAAAKKLDIDPIDDVTRGWLATSPAAVRVIEEQWKAIESMSFGPDVPEVLVQPEPRTMTPKRFAKRLEFALHERFPHLDIVVRGRSE